MILVLMFRVISSAILIGRHDFIGADVLHRRGLEVLNHAGINETINMFIRSLWTVGCI